METRDELLQEAKDILFYLKDSLWRQTGEEKAKDKMLKIYRLLQKGNHSEFKTFVESTIHKLQNMSRYFHDESDIKFFLNKCKRLDVINRDIKGKRYSLSISPDYSPAY